MGWFNIFKRRQRKRKAHKSSRSPNLRSLVERLQSDTSSLQLRVQVIQTTIDKHSVSLNEHAVLFEEQKVRVAKLEQLVAQPAISPAQQPTSPFHRSQPAILPLLPQQKYDVNGFSPQEKRILQVFFKHPDMALSYCDIGHALARSPNTIKNELRQIIMKADLFTKNVDANNRNRFKLKDGLKLEKYLNLG